MRKVKCKVYSQATGKWDEHEGLFHKWGSDFQDYESGPANFTIGIVELSDGRIVTPIPDKIQFLDRPPSEEIEQNYYFTFGSDNPLCYRYVKFFDTYDGARQKMIERFGTRWAFQYGEEHFKGQAEKYCLAELE